MAVFPTSAGLLTTITREHNGVRPEEKRHLLLLRPKHCLRLFVPSLSWQMVVVSTINLPLEWIYFR